MNPITVFDRDPVDIPGLTLKGSRPAVLRPTAEVQVVTPEELEGVLAQDTSELTGYYPEDLGVDLSPVPGRFRGPITLREDHPKRSERALATTVYLPDGRDPLLSQAYPWSTVGRIDVPNTNKYGTGVMVGPRHMLTASHEIDWAANPIGAAFTPAWQAGSAPYGTAWATHVLAIVKANPANGLNAKEIGYDYAVVILDRPAGATTDIGWATGWMDVGPWLPSWNGNPKFHHVGYPSISGGDYQYLEKYISMDASFPVNTIGPSAYRLEHHADVQQGQSGGPIFGWFNGSPTPYVVALQSGEQWGGTSGPNVAGGGWAMRLLVLYARSLFP